MWLERKHFGIFQEIVKNIFCSQYSAATKYTHCTECFLEKLYLIIFYCLHLNVSRKYTFGLVIVIYYLPYCNKHGFNTNTTKESCLPW